MTPTAHGGNVHAVAREHRWPLHRVVDFSASINPLGPSPRAVRAVTRALPQIVHYPDPACVVLRAALSQRHGLPADAIAVGNGSTELIHLLPQILALRRVLIIGPTFSEYARAIRQQGGTVVPLDAECRTAYRPPIQEAISAVRKEGSKLTAVVLCNPNSPTGHMVDADEVQVLTAQASRRGAWVIVDETFAEYCEECSVLADLAGQSKGGAKLIVLRSFTKFYAVPGLRVGYVVTSRPMAARMRARLPPWSVNHLAQVAAVAALHDERHAHRSRRFMRQERARFTARLRGIGGVTVYPSDANFLLVELPRSAREVVRALKRSGILLRDCSRIPGLSVRTVRMAVRTRNENEWLIKLLQSVL